VIASALLTLLTGCGGDDANASRRANCILAKENAARYAVVKDAYERGELGRKAAVLASAHPKARPVIFEPDGSLREWSSMGLAARNEFTQWATSGAVYEKTGDAQLRAVDGIDRKACE
jgi:hypothetical protein